MFGSLPHYLRQELARHATVNIVSSIKMFRCRGQKGKGAASHILNWNACIRPTINLVAAIETLRFVFGLWPVAGRWS